MTKLEPDLHIPIFKHWIWVKCVKLLGRKSAETDKKIKVKGHYSKIIKPWPNSNLTFALFLPYPHIKFEMNVYSCWGENEPKLKISRVINHWTMIKFKRGLHFPMIYPNITFELNVCKRYQDNERKPMITEWRKNRITLYAHAI